MPKRCQIALRGGDDAALFVFTDAGGCATEILIPAQAYFHKHQRVAVLHDEVNFAEAGTVVALHQLQTVLDQISFRCALGRITALAFAEKFDES
jgi:hypothetical protein